MSSLQVVDEAIKVVGRCVAGLAAQRLVPRVVAHRRHGVGPPRATADPPRRRQLAQERRVRVARRVPRAPPLGRRVLGEHRLALGGGEALEARVAAERRPVRRRHVGPRRARVDADLTQQRLEGRAEWRALLLPPLCARALGAAAVVGGILEGVASRVGVKRDPARVRAEELLGA